MTDDPYENVLVHLHVSRRRGDRAECICPAHDDNKASLSVSRGTDQPVVMSCHAGCTTKSVMTAIGLSMTALMGGEPHVAAVYTYSSAEGKPLYQVERWVPKTFRPKLLSGAYTRPRPAEEVLYRLPEVLKAKANADTVYLVEGERDCETARDFGLVATTAMSGASQPWLPQFSEALAGADVVIVADDDVAGRRRARQLVKELTPYASSVRATIPRFGKDISDHLWAGYRPELLDPLPAEGTLLRYALSHVGTMAVDWAWDGWFPAGMLSLIEGDPGVSKSTLTVDLAARWSTGAVLPDGTPNPFNGPVNVGMVSAEDDPKRVIKPRLIAAGGNPDRVFLVAGMPLVGTRYSRSVDLEQDVEAIREAIEAEQLRVLMLDPLMAFLGSTRTAIDSEVRKVLTPLKYLAEETDCAIICVRHLRKSGGKAVHAGGGSIAFTGQARSVALVGFNPNNPEQRVLAITKINVGPHPNALAYHVAEDVAGFAMAPRIVWDGESSLTAADLLEAPIAASNEVKGEVASEVVDQLTIEDLDFPTLFRRLHSAGVECSEKLLRTVLAKVAGKVVLNNGTPSRKVVYRLKSKVDGYVPPSHADTDDEAVNPQPDALPGTTGNEEAGRGLTDQSDVKSDEDEHPTNQSTLKPLPNDPMPPERESGLGLTGSSQDVGSKHDDTVIACSVCGETAPTALLYFEDLAVWRCKHHLGGAL